MSKTISRKAVGGTCDGESVVTEKKPKLGDEFRAGHDLYVYRSGKWRYVQTLQPLRKVK